MARQADWVRSPTQNPLTQQAPIWNGMQGSGAQVEPRVWNAPVQAACMMRPSKSTQKFGATAAARLPVAIREDRYGKARKVR